MRDIKFRFWDKSRHTMHEDIRVHGMLNKAIGKENLLAMQFTGLKDINGVGIYDGDVLSVLVDDKCGSKVGANWSVEFVDHMTLCGPCFYGVDRRFNVAATRSSIINNSVKVIGNVHENPELIK